MTSEPRPPMLMPLPRRIGQTTECFEVGSGLRYSLSGAGGELVARAAQRFAEWLRDRMRIEVVMEPITDGAADLRIVCSESGNAHPELGEDESYALQVGAIGIDIVASRPVGVMRGLATLQQFFLFSVDGEGDERRAILGGTVIDDRPRFPWRGLMIDVSRHFIPIPVLERQLDAMAFVKLNVLHLHLTDDQGFRVECRVFPELHGKGADGQFYTQDELRGLVRYAAERGIRVVPEFDLPGHASSWLAGYPHLGCRPDDDYRIADEWGCVDVCMNPAKEQVYDFLERFFADVLPLFPDEIVHIGGDEVHGDEWRSTPDVVAFMHANDIANTSELQARFNARLREIIGRHGKRIMGWDEVVHSSIPTDVVVQSWRGADAVAGITAAGYGCVQSHGYYLNALRPTVAHYSLDPIQAELTTEQQSLVLGGEACMWTEFVDADNLDSRVWPRTAAIAERFWSPREACGLGVIDRLPKISVDLEVLGMRHVRDSREHLEQLAEGRSVDALGRIVAVLVPAPIDAAIPGRETDRNTPLRRLRDVLPIDRSDMLSMSVWGLHLANEYEEHGRELYEIAVRGWERSCDAFELEFAGTSTLAELQPFVDRLRALVVTVDDGLAALRGGAQRSGSWVEECERRLDEFATPHAGLQLAMIDFVRDLVRAAGGVEG